ncbi:MAG TPA: Rossmann-like and DUF2520 domain-containing protein [Pyrinomonadaceae bacterium]|jgi:predicted short-subunit dehydrogenase-like oxidoreductase (DUF2520 family)|nr:Rossmann-like and DUF2520 domain-containing protein [Pyrinomonadaceae bacterium]
MPKPLPRTPKPSVSIIGAGRLGQALALGLQSSGYPILALVARRHQKAEKAVALLGNTVETSPPLALATSRLVDLPSAALTIIATPDDVIEETAGRLAGLQRGRAERTILHTSGALSSAVLAPLAEVGFQTGSIHPLIAVNDSASGAAAFSGTYFCLEGTRKAIKLARTIVDDLGGNSFTIKPESKALYHAAAVMASPHLAALFDLAISMLGACGLGRRDAQKVLMPLLESTVNNLKTSTPQQALTGTFARGDLATVRKHLSAMTENDVAQAIEIYKLLGLRSLQLAGKSGLDPERAKMIRELLKDDLPRIHADERGSDQE